VLCFLSRFFCGEFYKLRTTLFSICMCKSVVRELTSEVCRCQEANFKCLQMPAGSVQCLSYSPRAWMQLI
jgi:hypothetical protein